MILTGYIAYQNQSHASLVMAKTKLKETTAYLNQLIMADQENFRNYQNYFADHADEIVIPYIFKKRHNPQPEKIAYEQLFQKNYPGMTLYKDIPFDELSDEVKLAFTTYQQEYWMSVLYRLRDSMGLAYVSYMFPQGEEWHMTWMVDGIEESVEVNGKLYYNIGYNCPEYIEDGHENMWKTVHTGKATGEFDINDNEYGHTYAYCVPVVMDGEFMGLVQAEVYVDNVDKEVLLLSIQQVVFMAIILAGVMGILLFIVNRFFINRLESLRNDVEQYTMYKNQDIVKNLEAAKKGNDEIDGLSVQIATMIREIQNHASKLVEASKELQETQELARAMNSMANRDALTGVLNKKAYDEAASNLEWEMSQGIASFAIAMIDLNFLKRLNDVHGHDKGNYAIKKLCTHIRAVFKHSQVYRIGGDEFTVIIKGDDLANLRKLEAEFKQGLLEWQKQTDLPEWERISAAIGFGIYMQAFDRSVDSVFRRADEEMYKNKKAMKAERKD